MNTSVKSFSRVSDVLLVAVLIAAVTSRYYPQYSTHITIFAIAVVSIFTIVYLASKRKGRAASLDVSLPFLPDVSPDLLPQGIVSWDIRHTWNQPQFHGDFIHGDFKFGQFNKIYQLKAEKIERSDHKKFDLTDSLPADCTVTIGMFEINMKNGEPSIKAAVPGARKASDRRELVLGELPLETAVAAASIH